MAELNVAAGNNRHRGMVRSKKLSTRVDLTPMVDLGFLLITFFVFTTTVSEPKALSLIMPADTDDSHTTMTVRESTALTIIPISNNKVFYYHGDLWRAEERGAYGITNFSMTGGIGDIIREKQRALEADPKFSRSDLMLIIRPSDETNFQSIVDAMDEVLINVVTRYAFADLTTEEIKFMDTHQIK